MTYRMLLLIAATLFAVSCSGLKDDDEFVVDGISVKKNKIDKIVSDQIAYYKQYGQNLSADDSVKLRNRMIDGMIDEMLLSAKGKQTGIEPDTAEVNFYIQQIKAAFPSDSALSQHMAKFGMTYDDYVAEIKRNSVARLYFKKAVIDPVAAPDTFYVDSLKAVMKTEKVRASHILIKVDPNANEATRQHAFSKLEGIRKQAVNAKGKNFADLAKRYSEDEGSAAHGGDLNYFGRKEMVRPFEDAAFQTEIGQISDIVTTQFGYHLIKVEDKKYMEASPEEINQAALTLTRRKGSDQVLKELRSEFKVLRHENDAK